MEVTTIRRRTRSNQTLSESFDKRILDKIPLLIAYLDRTHHFLFNNKAYADWFGPQYEDLRGKHLRDLIGDAGYQNVLSYLERAFKGESVTFEIEIAYPVGKTIPVEVTYIPDRQSFRPPEGVVVLVCDITTRKTMQRSLHASETRFRMFMNNSPAISFIKDENGRFLFVSRRAESLIGAKLEDWTSKDTSGLPPGKEVQSFQVGDKQVLSQGYPVEVIEKLDAPRGSKEFLVVKFPFQDQEGKRLLGGVAIDITERRRAEAAHLESEARFRTLADSIPQLTWMASKTGEIFWYNHRWTEYTGLPPGEALGWGWQKTVHPAYVDDVLRSMHHALATQQEYEKVYPIRRKDGEWRWFLVRALPVRSAAGEVVLWVGTSTDVTESRKLEEEQRRALEVLERARAAAESANAAKSAFLANMSHEIRTPLGIMIGFSELLQDETLDISERRQFLDTIIRNGNQLARLIDDILDLSKVEAGKMEVECIAFSLEAALSDVMELFQPMAEQKGLKLSLTIEEGVPRQIRSDPTRLRQILINVIGNAVKFTSHGHIAVRVRTYSGSPGALTKSMLAIAVTDTGVGLTKEKQHQLFQPFSQGDPSTTRRYGGTGLGLILARRLARALGGDVVLEDSALGVGSTFVITIDPHRVHERQANEAPPASLDQGDVRDSIKGVKVLLAEDVTDNRQFVQRLLQKAGAHVVTVDNGEAAIDAALQGEGFDVILMDTQMPKLDGYGAVRILRRRGYRRPIIALTAHTMINDRDESLAAGCDDHLVKPLEARHLLATIQRFAKEQPQISR